MAQAAGAPGAGDSTSDTAAEACRDSGDAATGSSDTVGACTCACMPGWSES
eukprot:COSAG01_NODE_2631_length_7340_cov_35.191686_3_plen_51_part_00